MMKVNSTALMGRGNEYNWTSTLRVTDESRNSTHTPGNTRVQYVESGIALRPPCDTSNWQPFLCGKHTPVHE